MRKRGVQIIGVLFLVWACWNLFGLITRTSSTKGFLGIDLGVTYNGKPIDIMAWIGVYILAYIGFQLLRLDAAGRTWALIILWFSVIGSGLFFVFSLLSSVSFLISHASSYVIYHIFNRAIRVESPINLPFTTGIIFLFYAIQLYFLTRKDIKAIFQKQEPTEITPDKNKVPSN